jgi:hypothetical protein
MAVGLLAGAFDLFVLVHSFGESILLTNTYFLFPLPSPQPIQIRGFVEFWNTEACEKAATLNGKNLLGRPIRIDWTD